MAKIQSYLKQTLVFVVFGPNKQILHHWVFHKNLVAVHRKMLSIYSRICNLRGYDLYRFGLFGKVLGND